MVIGTIPVHECPEELAFDSANKDIYVANQCCNTVSVTSPSPVIHSTTITINPITNVSSDTTVTLTGKLTDKV